MENETVFRDKSIERISSPDQLTDYVKLTNPGIWFVLLAITIILAGACVFGLVGHIDSTVPAVTVSDGNSSVFYVKREYGERLNSDMLLKIGKEEYGVAFDGAKPVRADSSIDPYVLFEGNMQTGEWVYEIEADAGLPEGVYRSDLIIERISPLSFIFGKQ